MIVNKYTKIKNIVDKTQKVRLEATDHYSDNILNFLNKNGVI